MRILKRYLMFQASAVLLTACATVNPNPNIGLRSVDLMLSGGNCKGALEMLNFHANRDEPWAQFRLGKVTLSGQCPGVSQEKAVEWLSRAACFEPKSPWEKGSQTSMGETGFFNARESAKNSAVALAKANAENSYMRLVVYWLSIAEAMYDPGSPDRTEIEKIKNQFAARMSPEQLREVEETRVCERVRKLAL